MGNSNLRRWAGEDEDLLSVDSDGDCSPSSCLKVASQALATTPTDTASPQDVVAPGTVDTIAAAMAPTDGDGGAMRVPRPWRHRRRSHHQRRHRMRRKAHNRSGGRGAQATSDQSDPATLRVPTHQRLGTRRRVSAPDAEGWQLQCRGVVREGWQRQLRGRCLNCLSWKHRVATCRLPCRCLRCNGLGHLARACKRPRTVPAPGVGDGSRRRRRLGAQAGRRLQPPAHVGPAESGGAMHVPSAGTPVG